MNVGNRIRELRESAGYSQNKLAEWAGIAQTHLRRVELGQADTGRYNRRTFAHGLRRARYQPERLL